MLRMAFNINLVISRFVICLLGMLGLSYQFQFDMVIPDSVRYDKETIATI